MYLFALKIKHLFIFSCSCSLLITICYKYVSVIIRNISACCKNVTKNDATVNLPHWHFSMREISLISIFKSWQPWFKSFLKHQNVCYSLSILWYRQYEAFICYSSTGMHNYVNFFVLSFSLWVYFLSNKLLKKKILVL